MFISSLFCCLSFFNIGPVLIVDRNNDVFSQAMLEETLTKNLHLQQDLEHMSQVTIIVFFGWYLSAPLSLTQSKKLYSSVYFQEVVRLSKLAASPTKPWDEELW